MCIRDRLRDVPGFKRYPREPEVTTLTDGRGGFLGGQRIDRADYEPLAAGESTLPALSWNAPGAGSTPVSYTHLDVYKRQARPCAAPRPRT